MAPVQGLQEQWLGPRRQGWDWGGKIACAAPTTTPAGLAQGPKKGASKGSKKSANLSFCPVRRLEARYDPKNPSIPQKHIQIRPAAGTPTQQLREGRLRAPPLPHPCLSRPCTGAKRKAPPEAQQKLQTCKLALLDALMPVLTHKAPAYPRSPSKYAPRQAPQPST